MIRRSLALLTALVLPLALAGAARADSGDPPGTVTITPSTGGATRDSVVPVAGTPNALAYVQSSPTSTGAGDAEVLVRSSSGSVTDLGRDPDDPDGMFSLVDTSLTEPDGTGATVYWWDTATKASGQLSLPHGAGYLTSAPGGFLYEKDGAAYLEKTADQSVTLFATPFGGSDFGAVGGSTGVLFTSTSAGKFATWANPSDQTDVDTGGLSLVCGTVEGDYASCFTTGSHGAAELLKLDGNGPVSLPSSDGGSEPTTSALAGSTIVTIGKGAHLFSRSYSSSTVHASSGTFGAFVVSAYGAAIVQPKDFMSVETVTSASATPHAVFTAPYGPPNATNFSLAPGQVVYNDNRRNSAVPPATSSTFRTPVSTASSSLSVGATTTVKAGDFGNPNPPDGIPTSPLVSGTTTAYPSAANARDETESLTVTGPHRTRTLTGVIFGSARTLNSQLQPQISGNRITYLGQTGTGDPAFFVYDVAKDTIAKLMNYPTGDVALSVPAVSGNYVVLMEKDGSVTRRNLDTGSSVQIGPADPKFDATTGGFVFARGDYVGWSRSDFLNEDDDTVVGGYRNAATMAPAVTDNDIEGLAATGVIDSGAQHQNSLHKFGGGTAALPTTTRGDATFALNPDLEVEGRTAAWLDANSVLKVAPVDVTPAAPRMEGDTLAPKPAHPAQVAWHAYAPFSEPLTSCSVAVMSGGTTVATLSCNKAEMAIGIADVDWDGKIGSHHAAAGTYHYEITSAGDGGSSLDSDGHAQPVAGHFVIG